MWITYPGMYCGSGVTSTLLNLGGNSSMLTAHCTTEHGTWDGRRTAANFAVLCLCVVVRWRGCGQRAEIFLRLDQVKNPLFRHCWLCEVRRSPFAPNILKLVVVGCCTVGYNLFLQSAVVNKHRHHTFPCTLWSNRCSVIWINTSLPNIYISHVNCIL
jgi:hypothetical protein